MITFEAYPFRFPFAREFEKRMEWELKTAVFYKGRPHIAPLQYLDIQQLEMIERFFDLANGPKELFDALTQRAFSDEDRHTPFERATDNVPSKSGGLMEGLVKEAEARSSGTLSRIQRPSSPPT